MCQRELAEKKEEEEQDYWFNCLWPMTKPKETWQEKWLAKEEGCSSGNSSSKEVSKVTPAKGEDNPESGNCHPELGNHNSGKENDWQGEEPVPMDVNMVFTILAEFHMPTKDIAELLLGAEHAVFEKQENLGAHMKPLFIRGHVDGTLIWHMLTDGGATSTSCHCRCSGSSATTKVILNVQFLALAILQVIQRRQKE
jgi:hypothetical protein